MNRISMMEILATFKNTYDLGMSWWERWKAKNKQYNYHSTGSGLLLVYEKGNNKHVLTFYPRIGKVFTDMSLDNMKTGQKNFTAIFEILKAKGVNKPSAEDYARKIITDSNSYQGNKLRERIYSRLNDLWELNEADRRKLVNQIMDEL